MAGLKIDDERRFDPAVLRELAGERTFSRGMDYHRKGLVEILDVDRRRVVAEVAGGEDYRAVVTGSGASIGGECSCEAFENYGFCKHMVAVALTFDAAVAAGAPKQGGRLDRIRAYLKTQSADALAEIIVELAERDATLRRKLEFRTASATADDKTLEKELRKAVDAATRIRDYVEHRAVRAWAAGAASALDPIEALASGPRAALALRLAEHALARIAKAVESIDDSDGHCGALADRARDIHLAAVLAAPADPIRLAGYLFAQEMADGYGAFDGAAEVYAEALGEAGRAEHRRLAMAAWEKVPSRSAGRRRRLEDVEEASHYATLRDILDRYAEADGDLAMRIALRSKDLSSVADYRELAGFCREQGRDEEALRHLEEGLWLFAEDPMAGELETAAAALVEKAGRMEEAEAHLRRAFERRPSLDLYKRLGRVGGKASRERAVALLTERLAAKERAPSGWYSLADLLIEIHVYDGNCDAAWALAQTPAASTGSKERLAKATEATHREDAIRIYAERAEACTVAGGDLSYSHAVGFIARMAKLRSGAEQTAYLTAFKARHQRKRKLMQMLG